MRRISSLIVAGISALGFTGRQAVEKIDHQTKDADLVNAPDPARKRRGAKKSSGGGGRTPRAPRNWKRLFGGLAVPKVLEVQPPLYSTAHIERAHALSFARGPRPNTWFKRMSALSCYSRRATT